MAVRMFGGSPMKYGWRLRMARESLVLMSEASQG